MKMITKQLSSLIEKCPYKNSLFSVSACLTECDIENKGVRFNDRESVDAGDLPMICPWEEDFILVYRIKDEMIHYLDSKGEEHSVSRGSFINQWNGTALLINRGKRNSIPRYEEEKRLLLLKGLKKTAYCIAVSALVVMGLYSSQYISSIAYWLLLFVNILGTGVSVLLLQKELSIPNAFADKLCSVAKNSHCEDVTNSDASSLFGLVKLSEVGMGFFLTNLILLIFHSSSILILALLAICVLPFSFWSIWYQKFKAKSWCVLCLLTLFLMWCQAAVYCFSRSYNNLNLSLSEAVLVISVWCVITLSVNFLTEMMRRALSMKSIKQQFDTLRLNSKVIDSMLSVNDDLDISDDSCSSIVFGNPSAAHTITVFSNPYCTPCGELHSKIEELPGQCVKIRYIMTFFNEKVSIINRYVIAAYQQLGADETWRMLTRWYGGGKSDGEKFFAPYELDINNPDVTHEFEKQALWRRKSELDGTPSIIIKGRIVKWPYSIFDFQYLES